MRTYAREALRTRRVRGLAQIPDSALDAREKLILHYDDEAADLRSLAASG